MAEVEKGDEEGEGGGREESRSPLGCSCRGSATADIIHLIGSYRLRGISFSFTGPKVASAALPVCCCLSKVRSFALFVPLPLCIFTPNTFPLPRGSSMVHLIEKAYSFDFGRMEKTRIFPVHWEGKNM